MAWTRIIGDSLADANRQSGDWLRFNSGVQAQNIARQTDADKYWNVLQLEAEQDSYRRRTLEDAQRAERAREARHAFEWGVSRDDQKAYNKSVFDLNREQLAAGTKDMEARADLQQKMADEKVDVLGQNIASQLLAVKKDADAVNAQYESALARMDELQAKVDAESEKEVTKRNPGFSVWKTQLTELQKQLDRVYIPQRTRAERALDSISNRAQNSGFVIDLGTGRIQHETTGKTFSLSGFTVPKPSTGFSPVMGDFRRMESGAQPSTWTPPAPRTQTGTMPAPQGPRPTIEPSWEQFQHEPEDAAKLAQLEARALAIQKIHDDRLKNYWTNYSSPSYWKGDEYTKAWNDYHAFKKQIDEKKLGRYKDANTQYFGGPRQSNRVILDDADFSVKEL